MSTKHAFLILAHNNPQYLERVIRTLSSSNHYFFIHIDKKSKDDFTNIKALSNCTLLQNRINCNWGGFSLVKATLYLLKAAKEDQNFSYFHLISGANYFCSTNEKFDAFFDNTPKSFLTISDGSSFEWRLKIFTFKDFINHRSKWNSILWHFEKFQQRLIKHIPLRKPLPEKFFYGSQWFSFSLEVVEYILRFCQENPKFVRRFHHTFAPDEMFFHTIVMNSPLASQIEPHNLRFIDWKRKYPEEPLPRILEEDDYNAIVNSGCFFCRKISASKSDILLKKLDAIREEALK